MSGARKKVVIVGGGMGGLFTGALLAVNGCQVTVLEKNMGIGGGLQTFTRHGERFDTGMHVLGGFTAEGSIKKICEYLGIYDKLNIVDIPSECMDEITIGRNQDKYRIPAGKEEFIKYFSDCFPSEAEGIRKYVERIYEISTELPLFYLKEDTPEKWNYSDSFTRSADSLIAEYITDPRLRDVLAYLSPFYDGRKDITPAYIHALISVLYINGSSRFAGNSVGMADALKCVIEDNHGSVECGKRVSEIKMENKEISSILTSDGAEYKGECYVSAINPLCLIDILPKGAFTRAFENRVRSIPLTGSAFSVYISFKPSTFPYIDHTCYYYRDYGYIWDQTSVSREEWPAGFMYMTPPETQQGRWAKKMLVHCMMDYKEVEKWENTVTGHRGKDYEKWKQDKVESVVKELEKVFPDIRKNIDKIYAGSPLTIRDYYNTPRGAAYGFMKDSRNLMLSQLTAATRLPNLYLTGQNIYLHGICGVPLTAVIAACTVLGSSELINKIRTGYCNRE